MSYAPQIITSALLAVLLAPFVLAVFSRPQVCVLVGNGRLSVVLGWPDALCCLRRRLDLSVGDIAGVAVAPRDALRPPPLHWPGTSLPGAILAGTFVGRGARDFWDVRRGPRVLVAEMLPGAAYRRVVLELADPHAAALRLRPEVGAYTGTFRD